ncbi:hypothetical protein RHGRI_028956 [Rhododendron griersonianum]|uniref:Uncharacterized protein n=1 Tax=Rhododendron griersonianum TaxID=479676 RepID=A0AAV6IJP1_9ERIC|nr:hypothetical protein RHGRI_028956 [Rhododendron griersonianum]
MQSLMQAQLYIADIDKRTKAQQQLAERYKKQLDGSELERRKLAEQVSNLNDMVKQLSEATEQARAEGKKEMREEMEKKKEEGFRRRQHHAESYTLGYCKALDDAGVAVDDTRRSEVAVPPLEGLELAVEDDEETPEQEATTGATESTVAQGKDAAAVTTTNPKA